MTMANDVIGQLGNQEGGEPSGSVGVGKAALLNSAADMQ
jgi:hypothetical protein